MKLLLKKNLVKIYSESKIPIFGKTLKAKLIIAFFTFAFVPTFLMFLVSIFYINSSFDRWFAFFLRYGVTLFFYMGVLLCVLILIVLGWLFLASAGGTFFFFGY